MPQEKRDILFTENEVKVALMQFSARKGYEFKVENIRNFEIKTGDALSIEMAVFDAKENRTGNVNYSYQEIAAAMMAYCMFLKIPLPRAGRKSVQIKNGDLYLTIGLQS